MTFRNQHEAQDIGILSTSTFVLWSTCLVVGIVGSIWTAPPAAVPKRKPVELVAEVLRINATLLPTQPNPVAKASLHATHSAQSLPPPSPPPAPLNAVIPPAPDWMTVREPTPSQTTSQFTVPAQAQDTAAAQPTHSAPMNLGGATSSGASPAAQAGGQGSGSGAPTVLVYGQGEGNQPAPRYPARAKVAGQQGTVVVQFTVGEDGRVLTAEIKRPSPWPLLNEEALRTVRDRYRFQRGGIRLYEIGIRFELGR